LAAVPGLSPEARGNKASHIVVGKVNRVYISAEPVQGSRREVFLVAESSVDKVEKGGGVAPGDTMACPPEPSLTIGVLTNLHRHGFRFAAPPSVSVCLES
jgi:hypothetical protein